jgi:hypothetical protein
MPQQSSSSLGLPRYHATEREKKWVAGEKRTAEFIQSLWRAANSEQRREPAFLSLLMQCGWTNLGVQEKGREAIRRWRNRKIAEYLSGPYKFDKQLASALSKKMPRLKLKKALGLLKAHTGITHYYNAFRPATVQFVEDHAELLGFAFRQAASVASDIEKKIFRAAMIVEKLGAIDAAKRQISAFNGLTPVLACLDPQQRFPIMNRRTRGLLRVIGEKADAKGVVALYKLIGLYDVKNSFELDVYANEEDFSLAKKQSARPNAKVLFKDVGLKSEMKSIANITAKKAIITKRHNQLINRLAQALLWRKIVEYKFDALVRNWKRGRHLLIEAKTASEGTAGRTQIRQAIGQLYDYRFSHFPQEKIDLALLLAKKPSTDVQKLLASLQIEVLWFQGKQLGGTVNL